LSIHNKNTTADRCELDGIASMARIASTGP
jgi:hypothetical protein